MSLTFIFMNIFHFPSNAINDVKPIFFNLLKDKYSPSELHTIFNRIVEHFNYSPTDPCIRFQQSELILITKFIQELQLGKPLAYILGYTYFYKWKFFVNEAVLIPRPETEELVYNAEQIIRKKFLPKDSIKILDVGTGSGCIAISIQKLFLNAEVWAIDVCREALQVAQKNADWHQVSIHFEEMDILHTAPHSSFDCILSNPPYIPIKDKESIDRQVKDFEPHIALFSKSATEFYERVFQLALDCLNPNGFLLLELNQYYADEILTISQEYPYLTNTHLLTDWSNHHRFFFAERI